MSRRFQGLTRLALALSFIGLTTVASRAAGIADCEKISAADAYNRCLASFGPKRGQHAPSGGSVAAPAPERSLKAVHSRKAIVTGRSAQGEIFVRRNAAGRVSMQFTVRQRRL